MKIKDEFEIRNIAGSNVLFLQGPYGVDINNIVSFNNMAVWLWQELKGKTFSLEDVTLLLTERYSIDKKTAEADAKKWMDALVEYNVVLS